MKQKELNQFISYLLKNYSLYSPQREGEIFLIRKVSEVDEVTFSAELPFYSWKLFLIPDCENLLEYQDSVLSSVWQTSFNKRGNALLGLNILDLKAILLYDRVFEKDPYYQNRRLSTLIIAHNLLPEENHNMAKVVYNPLNLRHYKYDIFIEIQPVSSSLLSKSYKLFTGSEKGQRVMEDFGYRNYEHIEFIGPIDEDTSGSKMNIWRDKLKNHHNPKIWEDLGKICIECGKCTIACPTCFCFRLDDFPEAEDRGLRQRCWDSCFYQEFSEIAGGYKFLKNTAEKIHFWYYHKFARIPDEYSMIGCVGCRRCAKVCPAGIDIKKVLAEIEK